MPRVIVIERTVKVIERVPMDCYEDMTEDEAIQYETSLDNEAQIEATIGALAEGNYYSVLTERVTVEDE